MTETENRDNQQDMSSTDQQGSRGCTFGDDEMDSAIINNNHTAPSCGMEGWPDSSYRGLR